MKNQTPSSGWFWDRKTACIKTNGIRKACLDVYPPKQYETTQMVDQEIMEGEMYCYNVHYYLQHH